MTEDTPEAIQARMMLALEVLKLVEATTQASHQGRMWTYARDTLQVAQLRAADASTTRIVAQARDPQDPPQEPDVRLANVGLRPEWPLGWQLRKLRNWVAEQYGADKAQVLVRMELALDAIIEKVG